MPHPLPELFMSPDIQGLPNYYVILLDTSLGFANLKRLKLLMTHYEEDWDDTNGPYPTILFISPTARSEKTLLAKGTRLLNGFEDEVRVLTTTQHALILSHGMQAIWTAMDDSEETIALS